MHIYLPVNDAQLVKDADDIAYWRHQRGQGRGRQVLAVHGTDSARLAADMSREETLYLLVHGRGSTSNQVGGVVGKTTGWFGKEKDQVEYLTAPQLADRMVEDGIPQHLGDLRLMVCWAGKSQKKNEVPFAGQLCSALKGKGFNRLIVTGFIGAVLVAPTVRNLIIQTSKGVAKPEMAARVEQGQSVPGFVNSKDHGQSLLDMMMDGDLGDRSSRTVWY